MFFVSKIFTLSERNMWGLSAKSSLNFHNDDIGEGNAKTLKKNYILISAPYLLCLQVGSTFRGTWCESSPMDQRNPPLS